MAIKDLFVTNKRNTIIALTILAVWEVTAYALDTVVSNVEPSEPEKTVVDEKINKAFKEHFGDSSSKPAKSIKKREGIPSPLFYSPTTGEEAIALYDNPDSLFSNKEEAIKQARERALGKMEADKQREAEKWDRIAKEEAEKMRRYEEEDRRQFQERMRKDKEIHDKHLAEVEAKKAAEKQAIAKTEEPKDETPSTPVVPSSLVSNINQVSSQSSNDQCEPCSEGCTEGFICDDEEDTNGYDNTWVWDAGSSSIAEKFNISVTKAEGVIPFWKELPPNEPANKVIKTSNGKYSLMVKGDSKVWTHQPGKGTPYDFTCNRQQATLIADNRVVEFSPICAFYYGPTNP